MTKELLIKYLERKISRYKESEPVDDDWNPYDAYGGNMDDAYYGGERDGRIFGEAEVAAIVLEWFKKND